MLTLSNTENPLSNIVVINHGMDSDTSDILMV